jgi:hypothetical protein
MRFAQIVLAYFLVGSLMWAGGVIQWDEAGLGSVFIDQPGVGDAETNVNQQTQQDLEGLGGVIQQAAQTGAGGLVALWNIAVKLLGFLFWPVTTLVSLDTPPRVLVIFGGAMTVTFFGAMFRVLRSSA